ncbi:MAG TPA: transposase [Ktedonosporobacter sp.]|nr:transposase [Ktedonosporobacter sp.]
MVYRFLKTLKRTEVKTSAEIPQVLHYTSTAAVCLFMRHPENLEISERVDLTALRQAHPALETTYRLTQDFLQMLRKREVEQDQAAVQAGLTLPINNGQVEGHVTRVKLIKRMMYGKAGFALLRQRILHRI